MLAAADSIAASRRHALALVDDVVANDAGMVVLAGEVHAQLGSLRQEQGLPLVAVRGRGRNQLDLRALGGDPFVDGGRGRFRRGQ
jgi:hypothetical protein